MKTISRIEFTNVYEEFPAALRESADWIEHQGEMMDICDIVVQTRSDDWEQTEWVVTVYYIDWAAMTDDNHR